jgi:hypothetical protein
MFIAICATNPPYAAPHMDSAFTVVSALLTPLTPLTPRSADNKHRRLHP